MVSTEQLFDPKHYEEDEPYLCAIVTIHESKDYEIIFYKNISERIFARLYHLCVAYQLHSSVYFASAEEEPVFLNRTQSKNIDEELLFLLSLVVDPLVKVAIQNISDVIKAFPAVASDDYRLCIEGP